MSSYKEKSISEIKPSNLRTIDRLTEELEKYSTQEENVLQSEQELETLASG